MSNNEQWLTIQEAAETLGVSLRQCYRFVEAGQLPAKKIGRRQMIHLSDIDNLASELGISRRDPKPKDDRRVQVVQQSDNEIAQVIRQLQDELRVAYLTIGELRGEMKQRLLPDEEREIRQKATEWEVHAKTLEQQLAALRGRNRQRWILAAIGFLILVGVIIYLLASR